MVETYMYYIRILYLLYSVFFDPIALKKLLITHLCNIAYVYVRTFIVHNILYIIQYIKQTVLIRGGMREREKVSE